jgi:hypothetical protein
MDLKDSRRHHWTRNRYPRVAMAKKFMAEGAYVLIMGTHKPELDAAVAAIVGRTLDG